MDYKKKLDEIAALVFGKEIKPEEEKVELAVAKEEVKEEEVAVEAAPSYVTATEFQAFKDENEKFKSDLMETFEKMIEMVGQNEKNNVPAELSKEEVVEEVKEDVVEMASEEKVVVHSPESVEKEITGMRYGAKSNSVKDRIFNILSN